MKRISNSIAFNFIGLVYKCPTAPIYNPANYAVGKLKQVTGSAKSSGYGTGGGRTRRSSRRSSTRHMRGGNNDACVTSLRRALPDNMDYERMQGYDSRSIDPAQPYDAWVEGQLARANALPPAECEFLTALCARVNRISIMDMESCAAMYAENVFFDKKGKVLK